MPAQPTEIGLNLPPVPAAPAAVTRDEVRHVAALASLELTAAEEERIERDLNAILGYVAELNQLDTSKTEPMTQVSEILAPRGLGQGASDNNSDSSPKTIPETSSKTSPEARFKSAPDSADDTREAAAPPLPASAGLTAAPWPIALRADEPRPSLPRAVVLAQAPATDGTFFKVPKVIER